MVLLDQCFSTGVLWNLRVLPVASKGSIKSNQETGTNWHLKPIDTFSGLLMHPKCICDQGSAQNNTVRAYRATPEPLAGEQGVCCPLPITTSPLRPLSAFGFEFPTSPPQRQIRGYAYGFREQSKLLQRVPLQRKSWNTLHIPTISQVK